MLISANSGMYSARAGQKRYDMVNETVDKLADAGFEAIDINFCATVRDINAVGNAARETVLDIPDGPERLAKKLKERKISYSTCHLPYYRYFEPADDAKKKLMDEGIRKGIDAAGKLGLKWAVIHTAPELDTVLDYVRPYAQYAAERGVGIAIENVYYSTNEVTREAIDRLSSEGLTVGCCFDTGHSNYAGDNIPDAIRFYGRRIKMLHVHDNYGDRDAHQPPFAGNIKWKELVEALYETGYEGDFNYEISATNIPDSARTEFLRYTVELAKALLG